MMYVSQHFFECEKCGQRFKTPDDPALSSDCNAGGSHGLLYGICDARGRCHSLDAINAAMREVERFDVIVKTIILAGRLAPEVREAMDKEKNGLMLYTAKVQFEGAVMVWEEEIMARGVHQGVQ